jgi:hypothetical protein
MLLRSYNLCLEGIMTIVHRHGCHEKQSIRSNHDNGHSETRVRRAAIEMQVLKAAK